MQHEAVARHRDSRTEQAEIAVHPRHHIAVAVRGGEHDGIAGQSEILLGSRAWKHVADPPCRRATPRTIRTRVCRAARQRNPGRRCSDKSIRIRELLPPPPSSAQYFGFAGPSEASVSPGAHCGTHACRMFRYSSAAHACGRRRQLENVEAMVLDARRLHPLALVIRQILERHRPAESPRLGDDGGGDFTLVESIPALALQQAERPRKIRIFEIRPGCGGCPLTYHVFTDSGSGSVQHFFQRQCVGQ